MRPVLIVCMIQLVLSPLFSQPQKPNSEFPWNSEKLVLLSPTGELKDDLPIFSLLSDTSQIGLNLDHLTAHSFIQKAVDLYGYATCFLQNSGELENPDPPFLLLSQQDGGFARKGFYIRNGTELIDKSQTRYIDIMEKRALANPNKLMSITQLYPHEMGHILYGLLNTKKEEQTSRSIDMHYFSLRTDYSTAFNEGFSEHIENIARLYEENDSIRKGINEDLVLIEKKNRFFIKGFTRDFRNPFRIGYYKMTMPVWYQQFEDYKRHAQALDGQVRYRNTSLELKNPEDRLTYRNSGVSQDTSVLKNYVQMISTEGAVSAFFTQLTQSTLGQSYQDSSFYRLFLRDTSDIFLAPEEVFDPIQNQFLKYFFVIHNYMNDADFAQAPLIDFIEGYCAAFPSEEQAVKRIFNEVLHLEYQSELPPDLWILVKNHSHRMLVLDPYGAIKIPCYTFDLNAGEVDDFLTLKGMNRPDAEKIVRFRDRQGFFTSFDQLRQIPDLSAQSIQLVLDNQFDSEYIEEINLPDLTFSAILMKILKALAGKILIWYLLTAFLIYLIFLRREESGIHHTLYFSLSYLLQWVLFVVAGLFFVLVSEQAWFFLLVLTLLIVGIHLLRFRKDHIKLKRSILASFLVFLVVLLSMI